MDSSIYSQACPRGTIITKARIHIEEERRIMAVEIDKTRCNGCSLCAEVCSLEAMAVNDGMAAADPELCVECGVCVDACPTSAISLP